MSQSRTSAPARSQVTANVIRGCLGNLVEWYDWFVYATFSIYFAKAFFPEGKPTAQLLSTAVVFAVGFLMRPLGGWVLGRYADRFGRRAALTLSVTLMSAGSLAIALTPGYAPIGLVAPITAGLARLLQGLSVGGEFGSSATYLAEVATPGKRGFFSSFQYVSIVIGQLAALLVTSSCRSCSPTARWTPGAGASRSWSAPRRPGRDVPAPHDGRVRAFPGRNGRIAAQQDADAGQSKGLRGAAHPVPEAGLAVFGLAIGGTVAFYTYTTYLQKYMVNTAGIPRRPSPSSTSRPVHLHAAAARGGRICPTASAAARSCSSSPSAACC